MIQSALLAISFIMVASGPLLATDKHQQAITTGATMETSNVYYDMMCLYGEDIFNPVDPDFDGVERIYDKFKFYAAKPYQNDLYLYTFFKWPEDRLADFTWTIKYSTSTTLGQDDLIIENYSVSSLEYINHYGFTNRYVKYRLNGVFDIDDNEQFRIRIESIGTGGVPEIPGGPDITPIPRHAQISPYLEKYRVEHEVSFQYDDADDLVYEYFQNEYITITDKVVALNLVGYGSSFEPFGFPENLYKTDSGIIPTVETLKYANYYENSYCFFDTDKEIDRIMQIEYTYSVFGYSAKVARNGPGWWVGPDFAYTGLYQNSSNYEFSIVHPEVFYRKNLSNQIVNVQREDSSIFGWVTYTDYSYPTIIDVDVENQGSDAFNRFVNRAAKKNDGTRYEWGFNVHSSDRSSQVSDHFTLGLWQWWNTTTFAHEVKQAMILRIKYVNNDVIFDLNAWDVPTDTTIVVITTPKTYTVFEEDRLPGWLKTLIDFFTSLLENIGTIIAIALIVIATGFGIYLIVTVSLNRKATSSSTKKR